jgi:hypothetical protein
MSASGCLPTLITMRRVRQPSPAQRRQLAALRRDGALARLSTITGAIGVGVIVAVGALGAYVGRALPGHHAATSTGTVGSSTSTGNSGTSGNSGNSGNSGSGQGGLNPPATSPQSTSQPAPVTSGSS